MRATETSSQRRTAQTGTDHRAIAHSESANTTIANALASFFALRTIVAAIMPVSAARSPTNAATSHSLSRGSESYPIETKVKMTTDGSATATTPIAAPSAPAILFPT